MRWTSVVTNEQFKKPRKKVLSLRMMSWLIPFCLCKLSSINLILCKTISVISHYFCFCSLLSYSSIQRMSEILLSIIFGKFWNELSYLRMWAVIRLIPQKYALVYFSGQAKVQSKVLIYILKYFKFHFTFNHRERFLHQKSMRKDKNQK